MNAAPTLREAYQVLAEEAWRLLGSARVSVAEWPSADAQTGILVGGAGPAGGLVGRVMVRTPRVDEALRSGIPFHGPLDHTRLPPDMADDLKSVVSFTLVPLESGDFHLTFFVGWHEELTQDEAKEVNQALQTLARLTSIAERSRRERGENRLGSILERVADGIVVATGPTVTVNEAARAILGVSDERPYDPAALNTRTLDGEPHPTTIDEVRAALADAPDGQRRFRVRVTTLDKREAVLDGTSAAIGDSIVIVFRDVTTEHAREVLNAHYLSALFHYMPVPLTVGNARERRFISANRAFLDLVGYEADEVVGLQPPFPWWDDVESGREGYTPGTVVHRLYRHKNGRAFPVEMAWHGIPGADGEIELLLGMATDLTEKRRLDMQLVQSGKLAAIGELAAGVAHEINNPLFAILGLTEFLLKEAEPESKARQRLELIQQTGLEIKEIVRALLDFARENAEERLVVPFEDVVRSTVDLVRRTNAHKGVELVDRYDAAGARVNASPNQIKQIFLNLFANARQAMPEGGHVRVDVWQEGDRVVASVSDDGSGIPPVALSRIFEPFYTTRRASGGTGLGLSVSLGIAESHGGSLTAQSEPGHGATFTLSLPIADEEAE
ncbi:MAG TPA: ATP-binding protein [Gaiellaceae bacterium]|nr:ATP-binding protein [Gaiellaceae bacterium]